MNDLVIGLEIIIASLISIIVISNPVSTSAIFIALTKGMSTQERRAVATKSISYSFGILMFFSVWPGSKRRGVRVVVV